MRARLAALLALVAVAPGCGTKNATDAAQLVPANATAFVHLRGTVPPPGAFPFAPAEYRSLRLPKLAPPVDIALLPQGWVAFRRAKVKNAKRIRGFTVIAQTPAALDAVEHVKLSLADLPRYLRARLGDGALAAYLKGGRTLEVTHSTVTVQWHAPPEPAMTGVAIPKDAVAAVGLASGAPPSSTLPVLARISKATGIDMAALLRALDGPAFAYLEPSDVVPAVTVVATPLHPLRATRDVGRLLLRIGRETSPGTVDLGPLTVAYGLHEGHLVVSTSATMAATVPIDGLPDRVIRFAYTRGAAPALTALAPPLGLRKPSGQADFLLYETRERDLWSRVVQLGP